MTTSRVLAKLRAGEVVRTVNISRVTHPWLSEVVGMVGFDAVWLDLEHRDFAEPVIAPMALACRSRGIDLMVRIRKNGYTSPMIALENGAIGIMVPHCLTPEEARQWVDWCKYPPLGRRGFDGAGVDADYSLADPLQHLETANRETFLVLQIEDPEAVERIDEIAAIPGIDVLFVGPADLSISYDIPFQRQHARMNRAFERVAAAAARSGKWWGTVISSPAMAQEYIDYGARMINCGSDHGWLVKGLRRSWEEYRDLGVTAKGAEIR